jgi:hypothetical protein
MMRTHLSILVVLVLLSLPGDAAAQRRLHWDRVEVEATLEADGTLRVVETQTMVFSGDWNGGERIFNLRPRQSVRLDALLRGDGNTWRPLTEDEGLDEVDEFSWIEPRLRWRSRRPVDPVFAATAILYQIHYSLSGVLLKEDDRYVLDHDFLFPDRDGEIRDFQLLLRLDPVWQPESEVHQTYSAQRVPAGEGFVLTIPMRFAGSGEPAALDTKRSPEIVTALQILLGVTIAAVLWLFVREASRGRFAALPAVEDEGWLRQHVLAHPAEVIGAAWDDGVGSAEVVALLARMVSEGKLESDVASKSSLALRLKVDREKLEGYERQLIDKLFFDGRVNTNTDLVKQHYRAKGFNPTEEIRTGVTARLDALLPTAQTSTFGFLVGLLCLLAGGLLLVDWLRGYTQTGAAFAVGIGGVIFLAIGGGVGSDFRGRLDRGPLAGLLTLMPAFVGVGLASWFLWSWAGLGYYEVSSWFVTATTAMALAVLFATVGSMRSRQRAEGVAFRKRLTAARVYFARELEAGQPALKDEWFPWLLAFGLGKQMDDWSVQHADTRSISRSSNSISPSSSSWSSGSDGGSGTSGWTGFAGGRSGGGGASASWAAAAGSMAAGVSPPSSSSSSGGGGGGSSSSGGSSGGGGGGGW